MTEGATRLGVVGAGAIGTSYADIVEGMAGVELVAVADSEPRVAARAGARSSCPAFTSHTTMGKGIKLDAVVVCTPPASHAAISGWFLERGVPVLSEKPLTTSSASARRLLTIATTHRTRLTMASKFRFAVDVVEAKARLDGGEIGEPVLVENTFTSQIDMSRRWNADPTIAGGGVLIDNGTHSVDLVRYLLGPITEVRVLEADRRQGLDVEDTVRMVVRTADGVPASIKVSWSIEASSADFLAIQGTKGELCVGWRGSRLRRHGGGWEPWGRGYDKSAAMVGVVVDFIDGLTGRRPPSTTDLDALASVVVIEAAYRSIAQGGWQGAATCIGVPAP